MTSDPIKIALQSGKCRYPESLLRALPDDIEGIFDEAREAIKAWYAAQDSGQDYGAERVRVGAIAFKYGLLGGAIDGLDEFAVAAKSRK